MPASGGDLVPHSGKRERDMNRVELGIVCAFAFVFGMVLASYFMPRHAHVKPCERMFAMARTSHDTLEIMTRTHVYGGEYCNP